MAPPESVEVDTLIEHDGWRDLPLEPLAFDAFTAVLDDLSLSHLDCEVSLLGCGDAKILELNAQHRQKSQATNVLSWPAVDLASLDDGAEPHKPEPDAFGMARLGDIAISYETCLREAKAAQKPLRDHVMHLLIHGLLHLLGYDHERDRDAALMEATEVRILGKLGIPDPY